MFDFIFKKNKIQAHITKEVPIETFLVLGIGQINPYYSQEYDNQCFVTIVNLMNTSRKCNEKEGLVLSRYFTVRKCPRCKQNELIPIEIRINRDSVYLKHEEEVAYDAYEEFPSRVNTPTVVRAYCNSCSSCFEIRIKNKDLWVKEARKIRENDLILSAWNDYSQK